MLPRVLCDTHLPYPQLLHYICISTLDEILAVSGIARGPALAFGGGETSHTAFLMDVSGQSGSSPARG